MADPFGAEMPVKRTRAKSEAPAKRGKPFTTDYAREFCRKQGWKILHSEDFNHLLKQSKDAWLGTDVVCSIPASDEFGQRRIILIQAGQAGEEKAHRAKSQELAQKWAKHLQVKPEDCTLEMVCQIHGWSFLWVEFSRGKKLPDRQVWWVK